MEKDPKRQKVSEEPKDEMSIEVLGPSNLSLENALTYLPKLILERQKKLVEREEKLNKALEAFEKDRCEVYGDAKPNDVLHLNVGGKKLTVLRRTITSVPGSMLAHRFSGRWDDNLEKDKDGNYFIDQDSDLFEHMIYYLRNRSNEVETFPVVVKSPSFDSANRQEDFYRMVEYYGMTHGIFPTELNLCQGSEAEVEVLGPLEVNTKELCSFQIIDRGHERRVKDYEIKVITAQQIQIGWFNSGYDGVKGTGKGVGDISGSAAIDLSRSCILDQGQIIPINGHEMREGSIVRSENFGNKYYVSGQPVASSNTSDKVVTFDAKTDTRDPYGRPHTWSPCISVRGKMVVSEVMFQY